MSNTNYHYSKPNNIFPSYYEPQTNNLNNNLYNNNNKPKDSNNFNQQVEKSPITNNNASSGTNNNKPFTYSTKFNSNITKPENNNPFDFKGSSLLSGGSFSGGSLLFSGSSAGNIGSINMGTIRGVGNYNLNSDIYGNNTNTSSKNNIVSTPSTNTNTNTSSSSTLKTQTPIKLNQNPYSLNNNGTSINNTNPYAFPSNSTNNNLAFNTNLFSRTINQNSSLILSQTPSSNKQRNDNPNYNPKASNVKEYSYREDQNLKSRPYMEDMPKIIDQFENNTSSFFSLYDGHGGSDPVKYCKERMPEIFKNSVMLNGSNVEKAFTFAFQKLDDELKFTDAENLGTTATVCYIKNETDIVVGLKRIIYTANVGDTRCVLLSNNSYERLSFDHKATEPSETNRIKLAGGMVLNGRAGGQLALSRALGDHSLKKYGVSAVPYVSKHVIEYSDRFVIIASDGVWDVISEDEALKMSSCVSDADDFADLIVKTALNKGSRDNISVIVIKL